MDFFNEVKAEEPRYNVADPLETHTEELGNEINEAEKNAKIPKTAADQGGEKRTIVRVMPAKARLQQFHLGNMIEPDEVVGVANIHGCLSLVSTLCQPGGKVEQKLFNFFGVTNFEELLPLRNEARWLFSLVSPTAYNLLELESAQTCRERINLLGGEVIPLAEGVAIEGVLNGMLRGPLDLNFDLFAPNSIHDPASGEELLLAMVAAERIKVSWITKFDELGAQTFTTDTGMEIPASFCGDRNGRGRRLAYLRGNVFQAVGIPAKPENGSTRSMILVLPNDGHTVKEAFEDLEAVYTAETQQWTYQTVDVKFPKMDVLMGPKPIGKWLAPSVPEIFDAAQQPFDFALPTATLGNAAYVGKVLHFASFQADHEGAEAKAVTVASVVTYRSMAAEPPPPIPFHCTKPFGVLLVDGQVGGDFIVEFVAKIADKGVVRA